MGKLHKIRKAVMADPERFEKYIHYAIRYCASGAYVKDGKVRPYPTLSHRSYVISVLRELGRVPDKEY